MKTSFFVFTLSAILSLGSNTFYADEIVFRNGYIFQNVWVKDTIDSRVTVVTPTDVRHYPLTTISYIMKSLYNPNGVMIITNVVSRDSIEIAKYEVAQFGKKYIRPYIYLAPFSLLAFISAYDSFSEISYYRDIIDMSKINVDDNKLRDRFDDIYRAEKVKLIIEGIAYVAIGIAIIAYSFQSVEVDLRSNQLTLKYDF